MSRLGETGRMPILETAPCEGRKPKILQNPPGILNFSHHHQYPYLYRHLKVNNHPLEAKAIYLRGKRRQLKFQMIILMLELC